MKEEMEINSIRRWNFVLCQEKKIRIENFQKKKKKKINREKKFWSNYIFKVLVEEEEKKKINLVAVNN